MKKRILLIAFLCLCNPFVLSAKNQFVTVKNGQFYVGSKPYRYVGVNMWYASLLGGQGKDGLKRLRKELDFLRQNGVTNIRVLVGAEGEHGTDNRIVPDSLQPKQGVYDKKWLRSLDILLDELAKRKMYAVLYFSNNWDWSGGFSQYLAWNGHEFATLHTHSWTEYQKAVSKFYTCAPCVEAFEKYVRVIIGRTNSINGKRYINDPSIMAWQIANEPRPFLDEVIPDFKTWMQKMAALIKSLDKNHLLTTGSEGQMGFNNYQTFEEVHADPNYDYATIHIWPKNWSWFRGTNIIPDFKTILTNTENYVNKHKDIMTRLKKPLVIEEFGLPRDDHSFLLSSSTNLRNKYYQTIFEMILTSVKNQESLVGSNLWSFGGSVLPPEDNHVWKIGDPYRGDPPQEEQGLNGVYTTDVFTWTLIRSYNEKLRLQP